MENRPPHLLYLKKNNNIKKLSGSSVHCCTSLISLPAASQWPTLPDTGGRRHGKAVEEVGERE